MPTQSSSPHLPFGENKNADWYGKDILSVKQFSRDDLEYVFGVAHEMRGMVERVGTFDLLKGKILANLFYEPSTRTSSSFTAAMERLGGSVIPISEVKYSSVSKGESLRDTAMTLRAAGADALIVRHPASGAAHQIAAWTSNQGDGPAVINAGDGTNEHPTQALLDMFSIRERKGREAQVLLLNRELAHRVKNTLAVIQSIASQTLRSTPAPEDFRIAFQGRLQALAAANDLLIQTNWQGSELSDFVSRQLAPLMPRTPRKRRSFDLTGFAFLSIALGSLQLMLDKGKELDWFASGEIVAYAVVAAVSFAVFLVWDFVSPRLALRRLKHELGARAARVERRKNR